MAPECRETIPAGLTLTPSTAESVAWTLSLLDDESSGDREALADAKGYIAWLGDPAEMLPIALAGIKNDPGQRGARAWMVTTTLLQAHKAHRHLIRAMRFMLGRAVLERGYVWGTVMRAHSTVRILDLLGAEFRVMHADDVECVWSLTVNRKLWRTI